MAPKKPPEDVTAREQGDGVVITRAQRRKKPIPVTINDQTFKARPTLPGTFIFEHTRLLNEIAAAERSAESNDRASVTLLEFLEVAFGPDEWKRFKKFADDPANEVDWDMLGEAHRFLLGRYTGRRPTGRSSGSPRGPRSTKST